MIDTISFTHTIPPGNSETVIIMDSTRWPSGPVSTASQHASTGAYLTPGKDRGFLDGSVVVVTALCTTQNVTILDQILTGVAGTSADWETQGAAGSHPITAGTTSIWEFKPEAADFRIRCDAGATGPATLVVKVSIRRPSTDYGN
jgi:hypothetical protein